MTHEERTNLIGILVGILVIGYIGISVYTKAEAGVFAGPDGLTTWARTVLWVIPIGVVAMILATILGAILHAILTGDPDPSFIVDERDKSIGILGTKVTMFVVSAGFIMAIVGLALGYSTLIVLNVIFFSFAAGDLCGGLAKMILYRRGY